MVWECVSTASRLFWRHLGMLVMANILWLLLSVPIVTWPAATAGLFTSFAVVQEELDAPHQDVRLGDFWDGFRQYWLRSSVLSVIDLVGLGVIAVALVFYGEYQRAAALARRANGLIGLAWITAQLYVYPLLLERAGSRPWEIMREALLMALGYPLSSLSLLVTVLVLTIAAVASGRSGPLRLLLGNRHGADGHAATDLAPTWRNRHGGPVSPTAEPDAPFAVVCGSDSLVGNVAVPPSRRAMADRDDRSARRRGTQRRGDQTPRPARGSCNVAGASGPAA